MAEWIACSERLPAEGVRVLIAHEKCGYEPVVKLAAAAQQWRQWILAFGGWRVPMCEVSHWMPLPPPPAQQKAPAQTQDPQPQRGEGAG